MQLTYMSSKFEEIDSTCRDNLKNTLDISSFLDEPECQAPHAKVPKNPRVEKQFEY